MRSDGIRLFVLAWFVFQGSCFGQTDSLSLLLENQNIEIEFDDPSVSGMDKINLNDRDLSALMKIDGVSLKEVSMIKQYRRLNGDFAHPLELYQVQDLPTAIAQRILPFVVARQSHAAQNGRPLSNSLMARFRQSEWSKSALKSDDSWNQLFRYKGGVSNLQWGGMMTKDQGEKWGEGYLFKSGYLKWNGANGKIEVILGDYALQWAQGLLSSSSFLTAPSWRLQTFIQPPPQIRPFTSTMEALSKRGLISKISSKRGVLLVGVNIKRVHGAWVSENEFIPTSNTTFIDSTSISRFETARRSGFFLLQQWHLKSNHLGIGVCNDTLRNLDHHGFLGKTKWSFSWNKQKGNHHLFSEFTFVEMKFKCVMGALFHLHPTFRFGAFFSKLQIDQSPSGFLQSFRQQLEWQVHSAITVYAGVSLQKKWSSDISKDFFKRLFFVECEWKPKRNHQFYYRGFKEQQMVFLPWENTYQVTHIADLTHRVDAEIPIGNAFQFHTRFEFSHKERLKKRAQYYFFELDYHPFVIPVSCVFRYTSFDADDWNMRRFVLERGVSGSYNMRSLYGVGERLSVLMKWKPGKVNVQCKVYWQDHFQRTYLNRWASNGFGTRSVGVECLVAVQLG